MCAASTVAGFVPLGGCMDGAVETTGRTRPNILFLMADDLGWADAGYHGSSIKTPNIDRLAATGIRFERHYVMPTCTPTRVGLMSGRYPSRFGVLSPAYGKIFEDDTVTLPGMLRQVGYRTALCGKWHMGSPPEYTPLRYGFDRSYGYFHGQIDPYTHHYKTGVPSWHRNDQYLEETGHATDLITQEAIRVIESAGQKPFFLYVAYSVPHYPLDEPPPWLDLYPAIQEPSRRRYAASVSHMDEGIGKIIEALDRSGRRKDTLIVFVSDNGGQQSWHSNTEYHGRYSDKPHTVLGDNRPLRGWKGDVYEGGIRVPALVNWPGTLAPGKIAAPVHIVDWLPTLAELTGYLPQENPNWDGISVWPVICSDKDSIGTRTLYWKTPNAQALRQGDWKLVVYYKTDKVELYNLADDPYEQTDRAELHPERVRHLRSVLETIARQDG